MDGDVLAMGGQVLSTEGVFRDAIQGLLLQRIEGGKSGEPVVLSCGCWHRSGGVLGGLGSLE